MYKIIIDSCGELTDSLKKDGHFCNVALEIGRASCRERV